MLINQKFKLLRLNQSQSLGNSEIQHVVAKDYSNQVDNAKEAFDSKLESGIKNTEIS